MKKLFLSLVCLLGMIPGFAQPKKDPAKWTVSVKPTKGNYDIIFDVKLEPKWHVWSLNPGGDGTSIPPSFTISSGAIQVVGAPQEKGEVKEMQLEGELNKFRYLEGSVRFVQTVKAKRGSTVKGSYTYQLCNDMMCLPPKTVDFSVKIP